MRPVRKPRPIRNGSVAPETLDCFQAERLSAWRGVLLRLASGIAPSRQILRGPACLEGERRCRTAAVADVDDGP